MQETFTLRPFTRQDLEKVMNINQVCLPENYASYFFIDLYEKYPSTFIVAEVNHEIIGYIMCRIERDFTSFSGFSMAKKAHVVSIAVLPRYQKKGVGTSLMREALNNMPLYKAKECYLEVRVSNTPAVNMYKRLGFHIARKNRAYYADGEDAYVMVKKLEDQTHANSHGHKDRNA